jgi:hypothetical protein
MGKARDDNNPPLGFRLPQARFAAVHGSEGGDTLFSLLTVPVDLHTLPRLRASQCQSRKEPVTPDNTALTPKRLI